MGEPGRVLVHWGNGDKDSGSVVEAHGHTKIRDVQT